MDSDGTSISPSPEDPAVIVQHPNPPGFNHPKLQYDQFGKFVASVVLQNNPKHVQHSEIPLDISNTPAITPPASLFDAPPVAIINSNAEQLQHSPAPVLIVATNSYPTVDITRATPAELELMMMNFRHEFTKIDVMLTKLRRCGTADIIQEEAAEYETRKRILWDDMTLLGKYCNVPMFFTPPPPPSPPQVVEPVTAGQVATATTAPVHTGKRRAEATNDDHHAEGEWKTPSKKHTARLPREAVKPTPQQNTTKNQTTPASASATPDPVAGTSQENMDTTAAQNASTNQEKPGFRKYRIPPFYIMPPDHWQTMLASLAYVAPSRRSKAQGKFLKLTVDSEEEHRALTQFLIDEKVHFKSYLLEEQKPVKLVIRGLPINTQIEDIKTNLTLEGIEGALVTQMYRGPVKKKILMPLFHVTIPKQIGTEDLFNLTELMGTEVKFEVYRGRKGPSQCFRCQGFWHSASTCNLPPRCVRCAGGHRSADCPNPFDTPCKCAHCGGEHPANYRSCPKFPQPKQKNSAKAPTQNKKSTPPPRTFTAEKTKPGRSFAAAAQVKQVAHPTATNQNSIPQNQSTTQESASEVDFLTYLLALEARYDSDLILAAFKKALPALRRAGTKIDRQYIIYESIVTLSK